MEGLTLQAYSLLCFRFVAKQVLLQKRISLAPKYWGSVFSEEGVRRDLRVWQWWTPRRDRKLQRLDIQTSDEDPPNMTVYGMRRHDYRARS